MQKSQETAVPQGESFSWFDLVVLETPSDPTPRIENGVSLVWKSHANDSSVIDPTHYFNGRLYDTQITEEHVEKSAELRDLRELAIRLKGVLKACALTCPPNPQNSHPSFSPEMLLASE